MLLKAIEEVALAPNAMMAAEMAVIRLTHVADLPDPGNAGEEAAGRPRPPSGGGWQVGRWQVAAPAGGVTVHFPRCAPRSAPLRGADDDGRPPRRWRKSQLQVYASFDAIVDLIRQKRDMLLLNEVETGAPPCPLCPRPDRVRTGPGRQARPCRPAGPAPARLDRRALGRVGRVLRRRADHCRNAQLPNCTRSSAEAAENPWFRRS